MNDCLLKPINLTALEQQLAKISPQPTGLIQDIGNFEALYRWRSADESSAAGGVAEQQSSGSPGTCRTDGREASPQDIIEQAHKIKGAARIVQASTLASRCEALEQACARGDDRPLIEIGVKSLEKLMLELERMLQERLQRLDGQ